MYISSFPSTQTILFKSSEINSDIIECYDSKAMTGRTQNIEEEGKIEIKYYSENI